MLESTSPPFPPFVAGIAGGVVTQKTFQDAFHVSSGQLNTVSANIVSIFHVGAFFGALGSAPISCKVFLFSNGLYGTQP